MPSSAMRIAHGDETIDRQVKEEERKCSKELIIWRWWWRCVWYTDDWWQWAFIYG